MPPQTSFFFFFNDTATTEIYTLSLHDALPISGKAGDERVAVSSVRPRGEEAAVCRRQSLGDSHDLGGSLPLTQDRKSTRLNSSHGYISYAVFCLKKKKEKIVRII